MKKITLLSMQDLTGYPTDDHILQKALEKEGFQVSFKAWENFEDNGEDLFIIRTTWNYTEHLDEYLKRLSAIKERLWNPLKLIQWNCNKKYLLELQTKGVKIIPFYLINNQQELSAALDNLIGDEFIVKPPVGASARGLVRFTKANLPEVSEQLMVQSFLPEITRGENSLIFFDGEFKYAVKKVPKAGDIRVQEEHGGIISSYTPSDDELENAKRAVEHIPAPWLYARVDIVPGHGIIELECIEPALYFSKHPESAAMFTAVIKKQLNSC